MPIMQITTGENNHYDRRYTYDSAYGALQVQIGGAYQSGGVKNAVFRGFIRFNGLTQLQNKVINRATLKFHLDYLTELLTLRIGHVTSNINIMSINSSSGISWSIYDTRNIATSNVGQYVNVVLTGLIKDFVNGVTPTDIIIFHHLDNYTYMGFGGVGGFSSANPPILEVDFDYIQPVSPTNLVPNNIALQREKEIKVQWEFRPAFAEDTQTAFELEYSQDGGESWTKVTEVTPRTDYTFSYASLTTGSLRWRVRTRNSDNLWSSWVNAQFTWTQILPTRPQNLNPDGIQTNIFPTATWAYNSYNEDDGPTAFELEYSNDGGITYTTVFQVTSNMSYAFPISLRGGLIKWRVRAKSSYFNLFTPWSEYALWTYTIPPQNPIFTSGTTFPTPAPLITWSSPDQVSFELEIIKNSQLVFKTGERNTQHRNYKIETFLENYETYTIRLRVKNAVPLWSEWVEQQIYIDFVQTDQPNIIATEDTTKFGIRIKIINPVSGVTNEVWRRKTGTTAWVRIAKNIPLNGSHNDYMIAPDVFYDYRVRSIDEVGYSDSDTVSRRMSMVDSQLMSTTNTSKYVTLTWNPSKSEKKNIQQKLVRYAGRNHPCMVWGDEKDYSMNVRFTIKEEDLLALDELHQMKETLLYRDSRGRKQYVTILGGINIEDEIPHMDLYVVSFNLQVVNYEEAV
ncbi:fibronectin type III domain-containing protein [Natronincola ferrireducens]|uniref:Fibronectin type-III domain-containing protein n=1 Tax=Natronincola ferrireducens TaxID=393762 RepID=A0A1G9I6A3_9FIRM|nr:hypothetical protein [Natronincola ferrireducens]SDL20780.1 hypothetical protein SAMN05660472_02811 [Natronincola ferrireducens]